jgi:hypothetical protein
MSETARRPMTDEEFDRLLAARVRAAKAEANSPEAVKARRLDAARKRVFERQADVMSRTQMLPAGGQALAQVGALMVGDPTTLPLRALAARDQMGEAASAIGRGAVGAGKAIGSKAQGLASALAADPRGAARAAFVAPAQAVMTGARFGADALQAAPQAAQAVATDAQSIGQRVQGLQAPNVSREQLAAAVRATPRVLGDVAAGMSGALNMQRGFDEGIVESEARGMAGDYRGANLATMRAAGEFAMGGSSALGVGAMAAPALKGVARQAAPAIRSGIDAMARASKSAAAAPTSKALPALTAGVGIGGLALTAPDALSQTRQQVEDQIVQADGVAPIRPDGGRAMRAGFMQGMSLDWSDEIARALAGKTPEERALLQERIAIAREQGATPEELAQLMQAEYEADRVGWEAGASPSEFATGRTAGELMTGIGAAALAAGAGNRFGGPFWNNLAAGGLKGLAYGGGSGTGEVPLQKRAENAAQSAAISAAISGLSVPAAKGFGRWADNTPIAYQNWANKQRAAKWAKANPNPEDGVQFQPKTDARRFTAKPTSELVSDIPAEEAVQLARMADTARAGEKGYVPIEPRLEALVRGNRAGADAMRAAAAPVAKPPRQTTPRAKPEPSQGDALAADLALYGELRLRADRGEATPADLREMAKVKKRVEMPKQPRQPAAKAAKPAPMPMLQPLPPGLAGPEVLKKQGRDFVVPRMDDASAAALGGALVKPSTGVNPRVPSDPLSPQQINLQKMVVRGKERGMKPEPRKSQYTSPGENVAKGLVTAFAIPATGFVQDVGAKMAEWADGRSDYAREYDAAKQGETPKPPPLGAERALRGDVSAKTLAAIQADLAKKIADAEPTARAAALKDVAKAKAEVALLRAAMTPTYRRVTRPDGESVRVRTQAYRDALKAAEAAGLKPSAEALKAARERLRAVSGETFVADRVAAELADLRRQQRDAEAKAAALQRR